MSIEAWVTDPDGTYIATLDPIPITGIPESRKLIDSSTPAMRHVPSRLIEALIPCAPWNVVYCLVANA